MKKCIHCQAENKEGAQFCRECGKSLNEKVEEKNAKTIKIEVPKVKQLTQTQKTLYAALVVFVIILAGLFYTGKNVYSKENQVNNFIQALASGDSKEVSKSVISYDPNFKITKDSVEPFVDYVSNNKSYLKDLEYSLRNYNGNDVLSILQDGDVMFFYDRYQFILNPVYFSVYTNAENASLMVDGDEVAVSDTENFSTEVGPYAPGTYDLTSTAEINGFTFESSDTIDALNPAYYENYDLSFYGLEFEVSSDMADAEVFLNEESIGFLEEGYAQFGPISWSEGMEIHLEKEFPSGSLSTETATLEDYYQRYALNFDHEVSSYDISNALLRPFFNKIDEMATSDNVSETAAEELAAFLVGGADNELYAKVTEYIATQQADETINNLVFSTSIDSITQTDVTLYDLSFQVQELVSYTYDSGKDNKEEQSSKNAVIEITKTETGDLSIKLVSIEE